MTEVTIKIPADRQAEYDAAEKAIHAAVVARANLATDWAEQMKKHKAAQAFVTKALAKARRKRAAVLAVGTVD